MSALPPARGTGGPRAQSVGRDELIGQAQSRRRDPAGVNHGETHQPEPLPGGGAVLGVQLTGRLVRDDDRAGVVAEPPGGGNVVWGKIRVVSLTETGRFNRRTPHRPNACSTLYDGRGAHPDTEELAPTPTLVPSLAGPLVEGGSPWLGRSTANAAAKVTAAIGG